MAHNNASALHRFPLGSLLLLMATFYLSFMARVCLAPLMPEIEADLGLGHGEAGSLFLLVSLGHTGMLLASGFVSARLTHNRTILLSSVSAGAALFIVAWSRSLLSLRVGLVFIGVATGLYLPSAIATITELVEPARWGRAVAIHEISTNLAFTTAPLIAEVLIESTGWRGVLALIGGFSVLVGSAFLVFRGGRFQGQAPTKRVLRPLLARPGLWAMILMFSLGIAGNFGVYSMMPLYLVSERGMARGAANSLVALSRPVGVLVVFLAGWIADRFGTWRTLSTVLIGSGALVCLLGVVPDVWVLPVVLLQPFWSVAFFPPAFTALSGSSSNRLRNVFVSLTLSASILIGTGLIPTGLGVLGDLGRFPLGFALLGAVTLAVGFVLMVLKGRAKGPAGDDHLARSQASGAPRS